jgi:hypothetical protein
VLDAAERARFLEDLLAPKIRGHGRARELRREDEDLDRDVAELLAVVDLLGQIDRREPALSEGPDEPKGAETARRE